MLKTTSICPLPFQFLQDISYENILINHHGKKPATHIFLDNTTITKVNPPPEYRSTFPVRYLMMDFGFSCQFPSSVPLSECLAEPMTKGREHKAPEVESTQFNPFAADVYQTGRLLYGWFYVCLDSSLISPSPAQATDSLSNYLQDVVLDIPGFLELVRDMTSVQPSGRPSASQALDRIRTIRSCVPQEKLQKTIEMHPGIWWPLVESGP